jgi:hypothetical protein
VAIVHIHVVRKTKRGKEFRRCSPKEGKGRKERGKREGLKGRALSTKELRPIAIAIVNVDVVHVDRLPRVV